MFAKQFFNVVNNFKENRVRHIIVKCRSVYGMFRGNLESAFVVFVPFPFPILRSFGGEGKELRKKIVE